MTNATYSVRCAHLAWLPAPLGAGRGQWAARGQVPGPGAAHRGVHPRAVYLSCDPTEGAFSG